MAEIPTKEDLEVLLQKFKSELLNDLEKKIIETKLLSKPWLRSKDVRKLLSISDSTLQRLRIKGEINFKKIGNTFLYDATQF